MTEGLAICRGGLRNVVRFQGRCRQGLEPKRGSVVRGFDAACRPFATARARAHARARGAGPGSAGDGRQSRGGRAGDRPLTAARWRPILRVPSGVPCGATTTLDRAAPACAGAPQHDRNGGPPGTNSRVPRRILTGSQARTRERAMPTAQRRWLRGGIVLGVIAALAIARWGAPVAPARSTDADARTRPSPGGIAWDPQLAREVVRVLCYTANDHTTGCSVQRIDAAPALLAAADLGSLIASGKPKPLAWPLPAGSCSACSPRMIAPSRPRPRTPSRSAGSRRSSPATRRGPARTGAACSRTTPPARPASRRTGRNSRCRIT